MNNLRVTNNSQMWSSEEKIEEIRKLFAPKLTNNEFNFFTGLAKAHNLNPFKREIWSVKYDEKSPAQVFIGRDGYRKIAQGHSDYDFHQPDTVYSNDVFKVVNGLVEHSYSMKDRGKLVGAYCIAKRHKASRPMYVFVDLAEYSTGKSLWGSKPATMIKKVAEAQCLRAAFQDVLGGTYSDAEEDLIKDKKTEAKELKAEIIEETEIEDAPANPKQIKEVLRIVDELKIDSDRLNKMFSFYKIEHFGELKESQAKHCLRLLSKELLKS